MIESITQKDPRVPGTETELVIDPKMYVDLPDPNAESSVRMSQLKKF